MNRFTGILSWFDRLPTVLIAALAIVSIQIFANSPHVPLGDELVYIEGSVEFEESGILSLNFSPVFPAYLTGLGKLSPDLANSLACIKENKKIDLSICGTDYGAFLYMQALWAALSLSLVWLISREIGWGGGSAWLAMILTAASGLYAHYASHFLTETFIILFFNFFLFFMIKAVKSNRLCGSGSGIFWFMAAAMLALCVLTRPSYSYLAYAIFLILLLVTIYQTFANSRSLAKPGRWSQAFGFLIGYIILVLPWMTFNLWQHGQFTLTAGYAGDILSQRLAFNLMTVQEWFAAWIYWLPDFGDDLAASLFGEDGVKRLSYFSPDGFYVLGNNEFRAETTAAANAASMTHFSYLIDNYLIADFLTHILVSLPIAWKGIWMAKYAGLIGNLLAAVGLFLLARRRVLSLPILVLLPSLFMLGFHAFVSVNIVRYNVTLLPYIMIFSSITLTLAYQKITASKA